MPHKEVVIAYLYWIRTATEGQDPFRDGYIGMTTSTPSVRWSAHKHSAGIKSKQHLPIYRAINKYGFENLVKEVLVEGPDDYITALETKLRPTPGIGWNCAMGGQDTGKGRKHTPAQRAKLSAAHTGKVRSLEARQSMSNAMKGVPKSEAHKEKLRQANLGKVASEETKRKQSESSKGPTKMTPEGRKALSESKKALLPWQRSSCNKEIWSKADLAYCLLLDEQMTHTNLYGYFMVLRSSTATLFHKIRSGWNPLEDPAWLLFKENYDKGKQ